MVLFTLVKEAIGWFEQVIVFPEGSLNEGFLFFELQNDFSNYYQTRHQKRLKTFLSLLMSQLIQ